MDNATNQCSVCQATFATPEELAEHAKTHSGMGQMAPEAPAAPTMGSPMGGSAEPASTGGMASSMPSEENKDSDSQS